MTQFETAIVNLSDPVYDMITNTLTYTIEAENTSIELPNEFGQTILVIDDVSGTHPIHIC
ncbi:MAG: hypothetical protein WBX01_03200 [Nitrososphaeraceae archaeon]|jgi:hypothetical protein